MGDGVSGRGCACAHELARVKRINNLASVSWYSTKSVGMKQTEVSGERGRKRAYVLFKLSGKGKAWGIEKKQI